MKIKNININDLIPYICNSRTHSDEQVAQIAGSIQEFGFTNPVLIGKDCGIIAGHGRILAAQKLKLKEVPCIELGHLTDAQIVIINLRSTQAGMRRCLSRNFRA